jgi:hypothetical protein
LGALTAAIEAFEGDEFAALARGHVGIITKGKERFEFWRPPVSSFKFPVSKARRRVSKGWTFET